MKVQLVSVHITGGSGPERMKLVKGGKLVEGYWEKKWDEMGHELSKVIELPDKAQIIGVTADFQDDCGEGLQLWYTVPMGKEVTS